MYMTLSDVVQLLMMLSNFGLFLVALLTFLSKRK